MYPSWMNFGVQLWNKTKEKKILPVGNRRARAVSANNCSKICLLQNKNAENNLKRFKRVNFSVGTRFTYRNEALTAASSEQPLLRIKQRASSPSNMVVGVNQINTSTAGEEWKCSRFGVSFRLLPNVRKWQGGCGGQRDRSTTRTKSFSV